jgi:hypothetical protein
MGLTVPASGASPTPPILHDYSIQSVVTLGDTVGGVRTRVDGRLEVDGLNDDGQLILLTDNAAGGAALIQYANGNLTPVVVGGGDGPGGKWPQDVVIDGPVSMNQLGNVAFTADPPAGNYASGGMYLWDRQARKASAVALSGMPAGSAGALVAFRSPALNNRNEIAFVGSVMNEVMLEESGVFFLGGDGKLLALAPPGQKQPFSEASDLLEPSYDEVSLNDAGVVAFTADFDQLGGAAYVSEKGTIALLSPDTHRSIAGVLFSRAAAWVNNQNHAVLVATAGDPFFGVGVVRGLYRWADGNRTPLAVAGQGTPDGGRLGDVGGFHISPANQAGQHAFVALLRDGSTAAYLLDASGNLSLILRSGMATGLGQITSVGRLASGADPALNRQVAVGYNYDTNLIPGSGGGVALNSQGQVAVTVQINGGPESIVLLTPSKQ